MVISLIKYNKEEFKKAVKMLSDKHDVPEDIMADWLKDTYKKIEKNYRKKLVVKETKKDRGKNNV